jgi:kynurenine formamidase
MKRRLGTAISAAMLGLAACSPGAPAAEPGPDAEPAGEWIDLTHALGAETIFWPTAEPYVHERVFAGTTEGGYYYSTYNLALSEHGGTHLDAPVHFAEGRQSADAVPLARLIGPAAVIDVSEAAAADPDYRVSRDDILAWEAAHGPLPEGAIVLVRTGFASRWPDAARYLGTELKGEAGVAALHFPGLSEAAARLLAEERSIAAVGIDTASIDYGQSRDYIAHRVLLGRDIPAFENVADLSALPPAGAWVVALPAKVEGGSGAPLRIVARLPAE